MIKSIDINLLCIFVKISTSLWNHCKKKYNYYRYASSYSDYCLRGRHKYDHWNHTSTRTQTSCYYHEGIRKSSRLGSWLHRQVFLFILICIWNNNDCQCPPDESTLSVSREISYCCIELSNVTKLSNIFEI